jgi:phosphatidylglycerophosphate synthase
MACYTVIQLLGISFFLFSGKIGYSSVFYYGVISILLHVFLFFFLMHFKQDFFNLSTNQPLHRINMANRITLLRISCLPTITFLLHHKKTVEIDILLLALLFLVFLTDAFDGQIARRGKQITKMGQMLDSISDYSLLAVISIVYYLYNIVPHWLIFLIFTRLFLQSFGMFLFILMKKPLATRSTWGGKVTVAVTMILYSVELLRIYIPRHFEGFFEIFEYSTGALILLLYFEKAVIFFMHGKRTKTDRKTIRPADLPQDQPAGIVRGTTYNPERY